MSSYQWWMLPAMMKKQVMKLTPTMMVRIKAILSASLSVVPSFSPIAFAHNLHIRDTLPLLHS